MDPVAELRRQYRAARFVEHETEHRRRLDDRAARARSTLALALAYSPTDRTTVPGYAVWRAPDGALHVQPAEPADAAQLALWRQIAREEHNA